MADRRLPYEIWDVFTRRALGGNPLAILTDADDLDASTMQALAQEFNLSETAFLQASRVADARARYFTPARELPMAGHPTIGVAFALASAGRLRGERASVELGVGVVGLRLEWQEGRLARAWMDQGTPQRLGELEDRAGVARALGLEQRELEPSLPLWVMSAGVPFLLVPLRDRRALARCHLDLAAVAPFVPPEHRAVLAFTLDAEDAQVRARMFGEALGVVEDPATGSAHGPLGAYLAMNGVIDAVDPVEVLSRQGVEMGRPSEIRLRVRLERGEPAVEVGGEAVRLGQGQLEL